MRGCRDALAACALFPNRLLPFGQGQGQDPDCVFRGMSITGSDAMSITDSDVMPITSWARRNG